MLEAPISEDEVKKAVWSCGGEKAPGPDGFSFDFIRAFWDCIGAEFVKATKEFEKEPTKVEACNSSFIALVPKIKDPLGLNDFRPIHLMGCVTKVLSKVLAERLKVVVSDIINPLQTAFIRGRQITDGPFMVNEIISWVKRTKKEMFILKVDFEKSFDNVRWDFIREILRQMNFGDVWIDWIKGLICSAKVSVLVNGSPTNQFGLEKGVRQGDLLSPYIFIIVMEGLILALCEANEKRLIRGIELPNDGSVITNLHYADDALFLGKWNGANIRHLMKVLQCFHKASGLKINWNKSTLYGVGVHGSEVSCMAEDIGCSEGKMPFRYLGLPIGADMSKRVNWIALIDKFDKKLSTWKEKALSVGGRLTLCKTVLGSLGVYLLSLYKAPSCVLKDLESKMRGFFWVRRATEIIWHGCLRIRC